MSIDRLIHMAVMFTGVAHEWATDPSPTAATTKARRITLPVTNLVPQPGAADR
jgi:hypothetical protein